MDAHGERLVADFVDPDIFTVRGVFSVEECQSLIDRAETVGFRAASVRTRNGPKMMPSLRNNDRVSFVDSELAALMWERIHGVLPLMDGQVAVGVDGKLRVYRYVPGQVFRRHRDGRVTNELGQVSKLSYLVYLNDDFQGGSTTFSDYDDGDDRRKIEQVVTPVVGSALLFRHRRWHEGTPVDSGRKYVLRTDVFYAEPA